MVNNWINIIQDCLFPPTCLLCGNSGQPSRDLCAACQQSLPLNDCCCRQCGENLETEQDVSYLCGKCQKKPPNFDETHAPFLYQSSIRLLIHNLKFNARFENARLLGTLLADKIYESTERPDCIVPVPLHPFRFRERGFNQSIEIGRTISKALTVPLDLTSFRRVRNTRHQTNLPAKQRIKNMRNAFSVHESFSARHVAILDDVMTTGTTVNELAKTMIGAGVTKVDVWVCGRA